MKSLKIIFISISALAMCYPIGAQSKIALDELPLQLLTSQGNQDTFIIYLSGDGGWNSFSRQVAQEFVKKGFNVAVLDSYKYFWKASSPKKFAKDFEQLAEFYLKKWNKTKFIIVGYSFGADVAAFLPRELSAALKEKIKILTLLSPSASTDFEIRINDMIFSEGTNNRKYKVAPELESCTLPVLCVFGEDEENNLRNKIKEISRITIAELPGAHQYGNNIEPLINLICK